MGFLTICTFCSRNWLLAVITIVLTLQVISALRIYAPPKSPPITTPHPYVPSPGDLVLPYIHLLNGSSPDLTDPYFANPPDVMGESNIISQNQTTYVVTSFRNVLTFQCEANYPVFWNLAHSNFPPSVYNLVRVLSMRQFDDPFDPSTFKYITILTLGGPSSQLTGNYSCQSAARHEIQSSVYVFWESATGNDLVLSKQNLTVVQSSDRDEIHLPCHVSNPDARPKLVKLATPVDIKSPPNPVKKKVNGAVPPTNVIGGVHGIVKPAPPPQQQQPQQQQQPRVDEQLGLNDSVLFSPKTGFTLKNLPNPLGTYKCSLNPTDYIIIDVVRKNISSSPSGTDPNYTFDYDDSSKQVRCCTKLKGRKPPSINMMMCQHPSTCALREFMDSDVNYWHPYAYNKGRRRGSCSVLNLKTFHTGVIRCLGDGGFNMFKEFIAPVRMDRIPWNRKRNTTTYFRWEEIDPQEMIAVGNPSNQNYYYALNLDGGTAASQLKWQNDHTIYSKQLIHLNCHTSRYYFASGNYWMVRWKNQTMSQLIEDNGTTNKFSAISHRSYLYHHENVHANQVAFTAHADMDAVLCFAPVWNSSVWITKIHYLYVNESLSPLLMAGDTNEIVHYTWYANETEKVLRCSASGVPTPSFHWEKDNVTISATMHNFNVFTPNVTTDNDSSTTTTTEATTTTTTTPANTQSTAASLDGVGDDGEDNQKDGNNNNSNGKNIPRKLSHSALQITRVSYSTQGVYRCVATNFGGKVTKEFHITVLEAKSWTATIFFVISCVLTVVLMFAIIYLLRKLHKDRQEINDLTASAVNFQNGGAMRNSSGTGGGGGVGTSSSSSSSAVIGTSTTKYQPYHNEEDSYHNSLTFDNGKMTNNLIDAF